MTWHVASEDDVSSPFRAGGGQDDVLVSLGWDSETRAIAEASGWRC